MPEKKDSTPPQRESGFRQPWVLWAPDGRPVLATWDGPPKTAVVKAHTGSDWADLQKDGYTASAAEGYVRSLA